VKNLTKKDKPLIEFAHEKSFPAFLGDIQFCVPSNSSPYICEIDDLFNFNSNNAVKMKLLLNLKGLIDDIRKSVGEPFAALLGGSFLVKDVSCPNDIDILIFYKESSLTHEIIEGTIDRLKKNASDGDIDLTLCPFDYNPIFSIKMCSFYTHLFMSSKNGSTVKGCLLIDLAGKYD